jgi:hypothetical protein
MNTENTSSNILNKYAQNRTQQSVHDTMFLLPCLALLSAPTSIQMNHANMAASVEQQASCFIRLTSPIKSHTHAKNAFK